MPTKRRRRIVPFCSIPNFQQLSFLIYNFFLLFLTKPLGGRFQLRRNGTLRRNEIADSHIHKAIVISIQECLISEPRSKSRESSHSHRVVTVSVRSLFQSVGQDSTVHEVIPIARNGIAFGGGNRSGNIFPTLIRGNDDNQKVYHARGTTVCSRSVYWLESKPRFGWESPLEKAVIANRTREIRG